MRVLLLAPGSAVHALRWAEGLAARGVDVAFATGHPAVGWAVPTGVTVFPLPIRGRIGYFLNAPAVARLVGRLRPDLLNVHYASGYGTTAALVGYRPTVLSVWGSDVYDFPYQSPVAGRLIRWNLRRADRLASTSRAMADQVRRLIGPQAQVAITPFGVDTAIFRPRPDRRDPTVITIGTVKTLANTYGIDVLLRAFALLRSEPILRTVGAADRLRLVVVGGGPDRTELERLALELGVADATSFVGPVPHGAVPDWLNQLDVYVAPSRRESFGVAVAEASSCGLPVVASDVGGLPEVVRPETGFLVPRDNPGALAAALGKLIVDADLRMRLGAAGREFVREEYEWGACVDRMIDLYRAVVRDHRSR